MSVEELVVKHAGWINKKARQLYKNTQNADDLAGETIYKCLSQAHVFDLNRKFKPWALTIMYNTYISQYNRRKCILFTDYELHDESYSNDYADQYARLICIFNIIHECSRKSCCIECVLLYAQGYSYKEIAELVGIPVATVKSRISSGRKLLACELEVDC